VSTPKGRLDRSLAHGEPWKRDAEEPRSSLRDDKMSRLANFPFDLARLARRKYERRGQYRKATLVERYGADQNTVDPLAIISADCP